MQNAGARGFCLRTIALLLVVLAGWGAQAETVEFWIGDSAGNPLTQINVPINEEFDLSVWMTSDYQTRAEELLFGYDTTNSKGVSAAKLDNKIGLVSVTYGTVPSAMSSRHAYNWFGGDHKTSASENRPGGYRLAMMVKPSLGPLGPYPTAVKVFTIRLKNLAVGTGEEYYVGLWNARADASSGSSFCTKARTISRFQDLDTGDAYNPAYGPGTGWAVKVTNRGPQLPCVGANNRAVLDAIMTTAAPNYVWVFWGRVSNRTASTFDIDDGSGVVIHVIGANTLSNGDYVAVKGTLDVATKTLTSQKITKYN